MKVFKLGLIVMAFGSALLLAACGEGLSEAEVQSQVDSGIATAIAGLPTPEPVMIPSQLTLEGLDLVDSEGNVRAQLSTLDSGMASLRFLDTDGGTRSWIFLSADGTPNLILTGEPNFGLQDANGDFRSVISLDAQGSPSFVLTGTPLVVLRDEARALRVVLRLDDAGAPSLLLLDEGGNVLFTAPLPQ